MRRGGINAEEETSSIDGLTLLFLWKGRRTTEGENSYSSSPCRASGPAQVKGMQEG
jgi:hypothetical protein